MARKKKSCRGVTFVNVESDKKALKRKKQRSGDQEESARKKQRLEREENKTVKVPKQKVHKPISPDMLEFVKSVMDMTQLSILGTKRMVNFENVQAELASLQKMLLEHYKKVDFSSVKVENHKNLRKNLAEEKYKLEQNQKMLESLNSEVEQAVEDSYAIEESTKALEEKLEYLTPQDAKTLGSITNSDPLQLPKATFDVVPFQEKVRNLKNSKALLKELTLREKNPASKSMRKLNEKSFNEISYTMS